MAKLNLEARTYTKSLQFHHSNKANQSTKWKKTRLNPKLMRKSLI
jgi:hypothetical protein